ncbi:MAG TPA: PAS domain-containing protein [Gemmataceae bacterium]|nr:PAS domain-containing protein [Gemmataceae bacterium]
MLDLFDTSDFPARWRCGNWSAELGWLHILSDLAIWGAYFAIPAVLVVFARRRRDVPFQNLFWLFGAFIFACGSTHLIEAIIFWEPVYRLAGFVKLFTAAVSWATVAALFRVVPQATTMKTPRQLEAEVAARTAELKAANEALEASEGRFRNLTEAMPQLVWAVGPDHHATYLNTRWKDYTGRTEAGPDAAGWHLHPDDTGRVADAWQAAPAAGSFYQAEYRLRSRDGEYRWFLGRAVPVRGPDGAVREWLGTSTDIDDLKRTEAAARASREMLQLVLDNIPQGVVWKDRDSRYLGCNPVVARAMGLPEPAAIVGRRDVDLAGITPEQAGFFVEKDRAVMEADAPEAHIVEPMSLPDGRTIWLDTTKVPLHDPDGGVIGILVTWQDITDRRRAEQEVARQKAELQLILDTVPALIFYKDRAHRLVRVNAALARLVGLPKEALEGRTDAELGSPHADKYRRDEESIFASGEPLHGLVEPLYTLDGTRWLQTDKVPYRDAAGAIAGIVGFAVDVTERKAAEDEVRRLNAELEARVRARTAELEAANKELEAFSYSVSHDLRAPLRAIDGFTRILVRDHGPALPAEAQELLADVRRNAAQMGQLVDDLLTFSRLGRRALRIQRVDMADLVCECLDQLRPTPPARVRVADLPPAVADRALLKQVWLNLLTNALKYAGKREAIHVDIGALPGAGAPTYFVKDNGVGFDMRYAHKLFGVFQRLHRAEDYEGTGVGLATVQRIVHRHGGKVWAESEPDRGATFFFRLGPDAGGC